MFFFCLPWNLFEARVAVVSVVPATIAGNRTVLSAILGIVHILMALTCDCKTSGAAW
jgi:hypothetical protein